MKIGIGYLQSMNADMEDRDVLKRNYLQELSKRCGHTLEICLLYTSPSPRDRQKSRMPSSA